MEEKDAIDLIADLFGRCKSPQDFCTKPIRDYSPNPYRGTVIHRCYAFGKPDMTYHLEMHINNETLQTDYIYEYLHDNDRVFHTEEDGTVSIWKSNTEMVEYRYEEIDEKSINPDKKLLKAML